MKNRNSTYLIDQNVMQSCRGKGISLQSLQLATPPCIAVWEECDRVTCDAVRLRNEIPSRACLTFHEVRRTE